MGMIQSSYTGSWKQFTYATQQPASQQFNFTYRYIEDVLFLSLQWKKSRPDCNSNPGPLAYHANTLPTKLPCHLVVLWHFPPAKLDSSPNLLRTTEIPQEMRFLMLAALATCPPWGTRFHRGEKTRGLTRTQCLSLTMRTLCQLAIEPLGLLLTFQKFQIQRRHIYM